MDRTYEGSCHCGLIRWEFHTAIEPSAWVVRSCQCSFCRAHGARCTSDPAGTVDFYASDAGALLRYRFGLRTADFLLCASCGVYLGAAIKAAAGVFATLNLNAMQPSVGELPESAAVSYDSEGSEDRIERRLSRWTPVTTAI